MLSLVIDTLTTSSISGTILQDFLKTQNRSFLENISEKFIPGTTYTTDACLPGWNVATKMKSSTTLRCLIENVIRSLNNRYKPKHVYKFTSSSICPFYKQ